MPDPAPAPILMPPAVDLAIRRFPDLVLVLAAWRGSESLHGRLIEETDAGVTLECAGRLFLVPRPEPKGGDGG